MKRPFLAFLALLCTGCAGTRLVYGPQDAPHGTYPDLHDVPEKPVFPQETVTKPLEEAFESDYTQVVTKNDVLRSAAGLDIAVTN